MEVGGRNDILLTKEIGKKALNMKHQQNQHGIDDDHNSMIYLL